MHRKCGKCVCSLRVHRFCVLESVLHGAHSLESGKVRALMGWPWHLGEASGWEKEAAVQGWGKSCPGAGTPQGHRVHRTPPWGVGCNRIEGKGEKQGSQGKKLTYFQPDAWSTIMDGAPSWGGGGSAEKLKLIRHLWEFPKSKKAFFLFFCWSI